MKGFVYSAPAEIRFGWGEGAGLAQAATRWGRRPLVVAGTALRRVGRLEPLLESLRAAGLQPSMHEDVPPEPTLEALQAAMDACMAAGADSVIAIGGGSVLDIGKATAALAGEGVTAEQFFAGHPIPEEGRPILALPTTSGTGVRGIGGDDIGLHAS